MGIAESNRATAPATKLGTKVDVDTSHWPLVVCTYPRTPLTDQDVQGLIATLFALLRRREKHVCVMDGLAIEETINARQRRMFADFAEDAEARALSAHKIADVLLIASTLARGAVTAIFWLQKPVSPTRVAGSVDEAMPFLRERFAAEGMEFTPAIQARLAQLRRR
jgi:hypothetical protein